MKTLVAMFVFGCVVLPGPVAAVQPIDVIRDSVDRVIEILKKPALEEARLSQEQRSKIWEIINASFDFSTTAMSTLGPNKDRFTPEQKEKFTGLFARFLRNIYLSKIRGGFKDEKVLYHGQDMLTDSKALVKTTVVNKDLEIPIDYSLHAPEGIWRVYDVKIEGTSLTRNYRAQFSKILMRQTPAQLIQRLEKKVEEQEGTGEP